MGGFSNAAVAKIYQRFRKDIEAQRKLRNTIANRTTSRGRSSSRGHPIVPPVKTKNHFKKFHNYQ